MSALPQADLSGTEAESLATLAAEIRGITALLQRANDSGLSPAEIAMIPEATLRPRARKPLVCELEYELVGYGQRHPVTLNVYGEWIKPYPGSRETPDERGGLVADDITISGGPRTEEESIYYALSEAAVEDMTREAEGQL